MPSDDGAWHTPTVALEGWEKLGKQEVTQPGEGPLGTGHRIWYLQAPDSQLAWRGS